MSFLDNGPALRVLLCMGFSISISSPTWIESDHSKCLDPKVLGSCPGSQHLYFYNSDLGRCESDRFSMCPGGRNHFSFKSSCESLCVLDTFDHSKCLDPKVLGSCPGSQHLYFYNSDLGRCEIDRFSMCPGGRNHFSFKSSCVSLCVLDTSEAKLADTTTIPTPPPTTTKTTKTTTTTTAPTTEAAKTEDKPNDNHHHHHHHHHDHKFDVFIDLLRK